MNFQLDNSSPGPDIRARLGLRPVINASGAMTALGASSSVPEAVRAAVEILPHFVEINDLHRKASRAIAAATGAEAGFVTACASAGITLSIAGAMTGADLGRVEQLPDTRGMKDEVVVQMGHLTGYGAQVEQAIRLSGARPVPVGNVIDAMRYQLEAKITERTAAAVYVVSYQSVQVGQLPLDVFAGICRSRGVPVIVDLASEEDLRGPLAAGADLVIYSAHKFLAGLTAGIVAGRKGLVRATFLQNRGIGRGMKVGKEAIVATMAALEAWERRDHAADRVQRRQHLDLWAHHLACAPGVRAEIVADPTGNPIERLRLWIDPAAARTTSWHLADALAVGSPPVIIREFGIEHGYFELDPCHLHPGEPQLVIDRITTELAAARSRGEIPPGTAEQRVCRWVDSILRWPD